MKTTTKTETKTTTSSPFADVRRAAVPLCLYETSDPAETIKNALEALNGNGDTTPVWQWDIAGLCTAVNKAGAAQLNTLNPNPMDVANPGEFLKWLKSSEVLKELKAVRDEANKITRFGSVIFMHNAHRMIDDLTVLQATWNLRDTFKNGGTTLVLLTIPGAKLPAELTNDVVCLSDPKPNEEQAAKIIKRIAGSAKARGADIDPEAIASNPRIISRALGTSGFGIETAVAMSVSKSGLNMQTLSSRQRKMIEATKGLSVMDAPDDVSQIAGHRECIARLKRILTSGRTPVNGILFIDEIDKTSIGNGGQGNDGNTSTDQVGTFLKVTADHNIPVMMLIGPGGTGKSMIGKAAASISGSIGMAADFGACKGGIVGESEQQIRAMFDTAGAVTQWRMLIIVTCNRIGAITPEIRRRLKAGTYFVDFLSAEERAVCWQLKRAKFQIPDSDKTPAGCDGWTGAEIEACCESAYRENISLVEAAKSIVPVCVSARDELDALRKSASNKYLSASYPGLYQYRPISEETTTDNTRDLSL